MLSFDSFCEQDSLSTSVDTAESTSVAHDTTTADANTREPSTNGEVSVTANGVPISSSSPLHNDDLPNCTQAQASPDKNIPFSISSHSIFHSPVTDTSVDCDDDLTTAAELQSPVFVRVFNRSGYVHEPELNGSASMAVPSPVDDRN